MGAVTPFGLTVDRYWDGLIEGRSGITRISLFDASKFEVSIGGEIPNFDPEQLLDRRVIKRLDRYAQLALVATDEAVKQSGLQVDREDPDRMAVIFGSGIGGMNELEQQFARSKEFAH